MYTVNEVKSKRQKPDFSQLLKVLSKQKPDRPTLFEFFMNEDIYSLFSEEGINRDDGFDALRQRVSAFKNLGYDYATLHASDFKINSGDKQHKSSVSLNDGALIRDWDSYEKMAWNEPENYDYTRLKVLGDELPDDMKLIVYSRGGVLENVITLLGYENLCLMIYDEPELVEKVFEDVGSRLLRYYEIALEYDAVGAIISNDDWGFNTQTMLSIDDMEKYVFYWHKRIADLAHSSGRPIILHSCGNHEKTWKYIIDDIKYDGKHSYEDVIQPVEQAYELLKGRIAVMGGIDLDYVCREDSENIYNRAVAMLERSDAYGGYALGTGNSIPQYVPVDKYMALVSAVIMNR